MNNNINNSTQSSSSDMIVVNALERIKKKKESENSLLYDIVIDNIKYYLEKKIIDKFSIGESLIEGLEQAYINGTCFIYGSIFIVTDVISDVMNILKVNNEFLDNINEIRANSEEKVKEHLEDVNLTLIKIGGKKFQIPYGKLVMYHLPLFLSKKIYELEKKEGKEPDLQNMLDICKYKESIKISFAKDILSKFIPTYLSSVGELLIDNVMPFNEEVYDAKQYNLNQEQKLIATHETIISSNNAIYNYNNRINYNNYTVVNANYRGIILAIEKAIKDLQVYKESQMQMYSKLVNSYNNFKRYGENNTNLNHKIEAVFLGVERKISLTFEECDKTIIILRKKIKDLEMYIC